MAYEMHVKFDETEEIYLEMLMDITGMNRSTIIRQALRDYYKKKVREDDDEYFE